ncbi:putative Gamma-glutamyltranspeptidase 1 [Glarea lozoyensis 74030]|uniref:Putative Gamma-glutamyltranspeptidase 1 n=1 Tax=Glarea lozoyensis (strain ATCC 74030 / MF5533) TaxID=1104152 RepID=H0EQ94_GLAL7|nr:putative Gamma-glutamyltranspeptidase 1 [Glarea lozoyensis 74030]
MPTKYNVAAIQAANGTMTLEDMQNYKVSIRNTLSITYRGYKLFSSGAPSGGSVALSILKIIESYNMSDPNSVELNTHRFDEAMRFSYAARAELGDPDFFSYMDKFEEQMLKEKTASAIREHKSGLSITLTSTVNLLFGSQLIVPETGVVMNNEMNDFSIPEHPNGTMYLTIGAAGGSRIITATAQSIMHVLDHGHTLPQALDERRIHDQLLPNISTVELGFDKKVVESLQQKGHNMTWVSGFFSSVQGVRRLGNGTFEAAGEPRQKNSGGLAC